jgi:hypothetical protein
MSIMKKPIVSEQVINLDQMDVATCASLKGKLNERGECLVRAKENPEDPDILVLTAMKYQPSTRLSQRPGYPQG